MSHAASEYVKHLRVAPNGEKITPSEKAVLGQLADDHRQEVGVAWSSTGSVAARACMSTRNCRRIIRELEKKGVIETTPNLRESNGAQTSNECRFCQLDPPFNVKDQKLTAKRMELQKVQRTRMPVQAKLYPPDTDVRGGRTPKSGGRGHRQPGGADTDSRGPRTPSSALDPSVDSSADSVVDPSLDPRSPSLPSQGRANNLSNVDGQHWAEMKLALKSDLKSISASVERDKGFTRIRPDEDDYDSCFRGWWLEDVRRMPNGLLLITIAEDEATNEAGIKKYRERLVKLARKHFLHGVTKPVTFKVLHPSAAASPSTLADLILTPLKGGTAELGVTLDNWQLVKQEIEHQIGRLPAREAAASMDYFRQAVEATQLVGIEMDGAAPVWTIRSNHRKKTKAVLEILRRHVNFAIRKVAGRDVQILVVDRDPESPGT